MVPELKPNLTEKNTNKCVQKVLLLIRFKIAGIFEHLPIDAVENHWLAVVVKYPYAIRG